jgi:hypothetical protein
LLGRMDDCPPPQSLFAAAWLRASGEAAMANPMGESEVGCSAAGF